MSGMQAQKPSPTQHRSWLGRNIAWIIPVVVVVLLLIAVVVVPIACCAGGGFMAWGAFKKPVAKATEALNEDTRVTDKLGSPIEFESVGINNYSNENGNGSAKVDFPIRGPKGTANVNGRMQLNSGTWSVDSLTVTFPDGTKIELPK